ncbi:MAG: protoheme IX farnesyltransferase [Kouleothrix sp.]|nr:protoheme IX farnesyltransferase [Kouleothrix sp.]
MQHEDVLQRSSRITGRQYALIALAAIASVATLLGGASPTAAATLLSAAALAVLGLAIYAYVASRVGPAASQRLGARAQVAQRRYRALLAVTVGLVYLTLSGGALVTNQGGLWVCQALPVCATPSSLAIVAMGHRVLAALGALLVLALALQTWRTRPQRALRLAAGGSIALMLAQILVGMVQVVMARDGNGAPVMAIRAAHLAAGTATWAVLIAQATLALRLPVVEQEAHTAKPRAQSSKLKDYISLTKPGVITLLILTTVASMYITPAGAPSLWLVLWTFVGGWLMASGAHAVNCWADQDIDVNMGRTSRRPIPSGRIPAWHALALGIALGVAAFAILAALVNLAAALLSLAGYLYYVFIYTRWLKRTTPSNIVIGGGAGAFPPLVGWAAATGGLTLPALFLFAIIFYWTPPHFWALALIREKDYARASVPMLPVVAGDAETKWEILLYTLLMLALTIMPTPLGMFGVPYLLMALGLGALFLRYALRLWRDGTTAAAWGLYKYSLLYLALLFVAMVVDRVALS